MRASVVWDDLLLVRVKRRGVVSVYQHSSYCVPPRSRWVTDFVQSPVLSQSLVLSLVTTPLPHGCSLLSSHSVSLSLFSTPPLCLPYRLRSHYLVFQLSLCCAGVLQRRRSRCTHRNLAATLWQVVRSISKEVLREKCKVHCSYFLPSAQCLLLPACF